LTAFPLVPRYRLTGLPFGTARSTRRGRGSDLAGFRSYIPGDPVSTIDWRASARLSTARGDDEFVVREHFADEAPTAVIVVDRRPSMGLYPDWSPWLDKSAAAREAAAAIVASAVAARGAAAYLDFASTDAYWLPPRSRSPGGLVEERLGEAGFAAGPRSFDGVLEHVARSARSLGAGSFVFLVSDFLDPPPASFWAVGLARRWELVPVVVQDPTWEASFPVLPSIVVPLADPETAQVLEVRLRKREARAERERRRRARADLLSSFAVLSLDPVLIERSDAGSVLRAFLEWSERRRRARWQRR
jgi:uncharacterized protein (DUF58 family)